MSTPTYAEKVITLLASDSETFEQGVVLLEGLASGGCSDDVLQDVSTLFQGVDWDDLHFQWMIDLLKELEENDWRSEERFKNRQGDIFWRMIGCWLQLYPEMRYRLPSVLVLKRTPSIPQFLFSETSVNTLVIQNVENIDGFERLPTFEKIIFPSYSFQHHKHEIDWDGMLEGQNSQTIVVDESILALRLVNGQLQIEVRTGVFTELISLSSDPSICLPLVDHGMTVEQIFQVFDMQIERSSLDFGFVYFELNEETYRPVHERIVGVYLKQLEMNGYRSNSLFQELLNRPVNFVNLIEIVGDIELYDVILIDKGFLLRSPKLERIVLSSTESCLSFSEDVWIAQHPLQSIYVRTYEDCVLYAFTKDEQKTLGEQLWMVSALAEDVVQAAEHLKNVQYVHLFQSYGNLAQLTKLSALEDFQIELARLEQSAWMKKHGVYPTDFAKILSRSFGLDLSEWTQNKVSDTYYVVQTCEDWMCFERFQITYKFAPDFMSKLQQDIKCGSYTPEFAEWFSQKGAVRIGAWVCWGDNGFVHLKRYTSTGFEYWEEYRSDWDTRFSILNLERLAVGLEQSELCELLGELKELNESCKIRFNTPRVDAAVFGYLPPIHTMYIEEKGVLDYVDVFPAVQVLYLNGLGLTAVPECIDKMPQLDTLYLWNNQLQTLPNFLSNLENLRVINISGNPLNEVPEVLFTLPKLEKLFFRDGATFLNTHMPDDDRWNGETLGSALLLDANE